MGEGTLSKTGRVCSPFADPIRRTLILVNLASIVEKADEVLLPAVFFEVGAAFGISPAALGTLTFVRGIVQGLGLGITTINIACQSTFSVYPPFQAACSPLAAYVAQHHDRTHIIAASAIWWGAATVAVGSSTTYWEIALARALNGVGLAVVLPSIQSFVADTHTAEQRGSGFGWLQFTNYSGSILGGVCGTLLAGSSFFGIAGWRVAFYLLAVVSFVLGGLVYTCGVDPCYPREIEKLDDGSIVIPKPPSFRANLAQLWASAKTVYKLQTFQVILSQGVVGSIPWSAMVFYTLWLELVGYSHQMAAILVAGFSVGSCLGGLFGGYMGDFLAKRSPDKGRIICSQISALSAIPLTAVLLFVVPRSPLFWPLHGFTLFLNGFLVSWNGPATNNPIFAEIVEPKLRTAVYAFDRSLVPLAALGAPAVGIIAEYFFGYDSTDTASPMPPSEKAANASALGNGIFVVTAIPFVLCALIYSLLYRTYPKDRARALQAQELAMVREPSFVGLSENLSEGDPEMELDDLPEKDGHEAREGEEENLLVDGNKGAEGQHYAESRLDSVL